MDKLLVIEDDANTLYALQAKFSVIGFKVFTSTGETIENILRKIFDYRPDFIILDIILPNINYQELFKKIKADDSTSSIPIFIFTNISNKDAEVKSRELGVDYFFIKQDFLLDDFVEKVQKIIDNKYK